MLAIVETSEQGNLIIMSQSCPYIYSDKYLSSFVLISYLKPILWINFLGKAL